VSASPDRVSAADRRRAGPRYSRGPRADGTGNARPDTWRTR
jgi:hypothetical protein